MGYNVCSSAREASATLAMGKYIATNKNDIKFSFIPGMSSSASVTVYIEDVNDIAPEFSQSSYSVAVPENLAFEATIGMVNVLRTITS